MVEYLFYQILLQDPHLEDISSCDQPNLDTCSAPPCYLVTISDQRPQTNKPADKVQGTRINHYCLVLPPLHVHPTNSPFGPKAPFIAAAGVIPQQVLGQCTVVSSSSKSGTLNPALNGLYFLMRQLDHNQIFTRPGSMTRSRSGKHLVSDWRIKRYSPLSAGLSVPPKHHSAFSQHPDS